MLNVAVCDDDAQIAETISRSLFHAFNECDLECQMDVYTNPRSLIEKHTEKPFNVMFLDIDMPDMSGFELSEAAKKISSYCLIVFVSAKKDLVFKSFDFSPFYFVYKGDDVRLNNDLKHVVSKLASYYQKYKKIIIKDYAAGKLLVTLSDIIYIKSKGHYLFYYTKNSNNPYTARGSIEETIHTLSCSDMIRPHLRYIVNMNYITLYSNSGKYITLENGEKIPISSTYSDSAMKAYMMFSRR